VIAAAVAAQRDLIELFTFFIDTQYADMAYMVVTTGVHATRNIKVDFTQVVQVIKIVKACLNGFCNRNGLGVCQCTEVATRAADHVGQ